MKNIIVVEDNTAIRKLFCTLLKKQGYEVADFGNGESVLKELNNLKPDLIVLDILLPDINGTDLIAKIRAIPHCSNVPAIAVTGFSTEQDAIKFKEFGFNGYLSKPINTDSFISEVKKHINE
jgi:two-component system alkaline phosphatase synthesis response regulator PhoP